MAESHPTKPGAITVAVDCSVFDYPHGGLASFFRPYLTLVLQEFPRHFFFLVAPENADMGEWTRFSNAGLVRYSASKSLLFGKGASLRKLFALSLALHRLKADFLLSPYYTFYMSPRYFNKSIIAVHDTCFWDVPQFYSFRDRFMHKSFLWWNSRLAGAVITVSETSKMRLRRNMPHIADNSITVVYNAWDDEAKPAHPSAPPPGTRLEACLRNAPAKLLLSSGGFSPSKNVDTVLEALRRAAGQRDDLGLVLTGNARYAGELWQMVDALGLHGHVFPTGVVSPMEMQWLAEERCAAAVCMSAYEGFGRSVVEAMRAGLPLICSDIPTNREIAGKYPECYCGLHDAEGLGRAMAHIVDCPRHPRIFDKRFSLSQTWKVFAERFEASLQAAMKQE